MKLRLCNVRKQRKLLKQYFLIKYKASLAETPGSQEFFHPRTQSCLTLCNPMKCRPPGSSVHEIFQARILEWVAISYSRESSLARDRTGVSFGRQILYHCTPGKPQEFFGWYILFIL